MCRLYRKSRLPTPPNPATVSQLGGVPICSGGNSDPTGNSGLCCCVASYLHNAERCTYVTNIGNSLPLPLHCYLPNACAARLSQSFVLWGPAAPPWIQCQSLMDVHIRKRIYHPREPMVAATGERRRRSGLAGETLKTACCAARGGHNVAVWGSRRLASALSPQSSSSSSSLP